MHHADNKNEVITSESFAKPAAQTFILVLVLLQLGGLIMQTQDQDQNCDLLVKKNIESRQRRGG